FLYDGEGFREDVIEHILNRIQPLLLQLVEFVVSILPFRQREFLFLVRRLAVSTARQNRGLPVGPGAVYLAVAARRAGIAYAEAQLQTDVGLSGLDVGYRFTNFVPKALGQSLQLVVGQAREFLCVLVDLFDDRPELRPGALVLVAKDLFQDLE